MPRTPTTEEARHLAGPLLEPLGRRWIHVQAVAERARELAPAVAEQDRDLLVVAAWLHDVGYAPGVRATGSHQIDGAEHLARRGYPHRLCALVAHHSAASYEIAERGLTDRLARWEDESSPVTDALWTADMTTGPDGRRMTHTERLDEILERYEPDSVVARAMLAARGSIERAVTATATRLAGPQRI
ncbi:HD domain-containing protein [Pseudonocardia sp. HH130630-07]|uniref:HD domain-containing protein n=1 Tax=Pseudonocardia sp. HH130630-07 TaxID=1690815 RepID=UPI000814F7F7|nr:HD domain-containing protein [Pseudonocardia sp. HH130630-07]ANY05154.1 phosphohydrolase [Pseudonocardia sp. HH130630-07]